MPQFLEKMHPHSKYINWHLSNTMGTKPSVISSHNWSCTVQWWLFTLPNQSFVTLFHKKNHATISHFEMVPFSGGMSTPFCGFICCDNAFVFLRPVNIIRDMRQSLLAEFARYKLQKEEITLQKPRKCFKRGCDVPFKLHKRNNTFMSSRRYVNQSRPKQDLWILMEQKYTRTIKA